MVLLTPKGIRENDAAIIIQKWWRKYYYKLFDTTGSDIESDVTIDSITEDSTESSDSRPLIRNRLKRRRVDVESEYDGDMDDGDMDNSDNEYNRQELTTVNDNNFLWDFVMSLYTYFLRFFGF